jgi:hypothetical protein
VDRLPRGLALAVLIAAIEKWVVGGGAAATEAAPLTLSPRSTICDALLDSARQSE